MTTNDALTREHQHPFRKLTLHAFAGVGNAEGRAIARLYPYDAVPMDFTGATVAEVTEKAEAFRAEAIEKHEASVIRRADAREAAKAKRSVAASKEVQP